MKKLLCLIAVAILIFSTACTKQTEVNPSENITEEKENPVELTLYFADKKGLGLVKNTVKTELDGRTMEEAVVETLLKGPKEETMSQLIPQGTTLNDVQVEDGICTVDLSKEFADNASGASVSDTLLVYSIVNSLTELNGVESVMFLIDGESLEIYGNLIFDEPFERDSKLIIE